MSDRLPRSPPLEERSVPLPRPGELLIYDYRPQGSSSPWSAGTVGLVFGEELVATQNSSRDKAGTSRPQVHTTSSSSTQKIRCLQWNIERNYKPKEILDTLKALDADVLCLQEIDIGCHRSGFDRDHFQEICETLQLVGGFVPEFWELEHACRKVRDQGGGVHGNAILSKWPISGFRVLDHVHHAYEWEANGHKLNEPRLGRRFTIVAQIETPSGPLLAYCAHLEVFTGIVGRISALSDILADADLHKEQVPHQILFGDLNTISHSIARLAKSISTDQYRFLSLMQQEAEWWDRNLWSWHVDDGEFNLALASGGFDWLRRFGILGLGTGASANRHAAHLAGGRQHQHPYWNTDTKYTAWLKHLVNDGLNKVKRARQMQLQSERSILYQNNKGSYGSKSDSRRPSQSSTIPSPTSPPLHSLRHYHHYHPYHRHEGGETWSETDGAESENSFQDDGSVVLVGRPRIRVKALGSSAIDRDDKDSLASLSPTESLDGESVTEDGREELVIRDADQATASIASSFNSSTDKAGNINRRGNIGIVTNHLSSMCGESSSVPSTPLKSPTLRLIPPTPKGESPKSLAAVGATDDERGINLEYRDDTDNLEDLQQHPLQHHHYGVKGDEASGFYEGYGYYDDAERHFERQRYYKSRRSTGQHQHGYVADEDEQEMQATRARRAKALARRIYENGEDDAFQTSFTQQQQLQFQEHQRFHHHDFHEYHPYHDRHPHDVYDQYNDSYDDKHVHDQQQQIHHSIRRRFIDDKISSTQSQEHYSQDTFEEPRPPFSLLGLEEPFLTHHRLWSGFTPLVLYQARNPGFYDPWNAGKDMTLHNPNFLGLLSAKLDYTLLRNLECHSRARGNQDYSASDHQWLIVTVTFERDFKLDNDDEEEEDSSDDDGSDSSDSDEGKDLMVEAEEKKELTQLEKEYLWWRQKRMQWQQPVQPLGLHCTLGHKAKKLDPTNSASPSNPSSLSSWIKSAFLIGAAATAAAWWFKK